MTDSHYYISDNNIINYSVTSIYMYHMKHEKN